MSEYISDRKSQELDQENVRNLFDREMMEVDERLISPEEAMDMLRNYVDKYNAA